MSPGRLPNQQQKHASMNSQRMTMAGWADSRTETMSTLDGSQQQEQLEMTIENHLKNQCNQQYPPGKAATVPPSRNSEKSGRWLFIVLGLSAVICAGLAVGLHLYNQSIQEEQRNAAVASNKVAKDTSSAVPVKVQTQNPTSSPTFTTTTTATTTTVPPPTDLPTSSPSLGADFVITNPLEPSSMPAVATITNPSEKSNSPTATPTMLEPTKTNKPSLRPSLRPNVSSNTNTPTVAPSPFPTVATTIYSTNRLATLLPTLSPTMTTTANGIYVRPSRTPTVRPTDLPTNLPTDPTEAPTVDIVLAPTANPTFRSSLAPTSMPTVAPTTILPTEAQTQSTLPPTSLNFSKTVIEPNQRLNRAEFIYSPNGRYRVGLTEIGDFQLIDTSTDELIWNANITGGYRCFMQGDGNCIIRNEVGKGLWSTKTSKNNNSQLVLDNGGMLGILHEGSYLWIQGVPRGVYNDANIGLPPHGGIQFPIRGAFYYPWYPETWRVGGELALFEPDPPLGYYNSADPAVIDVHIDHFEYGNIELGILSWWGQSKNNDRARISLLQNRTQSRGSNIKWTVYYEELHRPRSVEQVASDLAYLKKWFAWHPTWAHVDGKPVVFVYHNRGCENAERWMEASKGEWHVVLKLFYRFGACAVQPSSWHNYGPASEVLYHKGHSFSISPGFWHAAEPEPRLPRVNQTRWCEMIQEMVDSQAPWQLITTFNEAGEGTMIEPSASWASGSGYGYYLDCLHQIS